MAYTSDKKPTELSTLTSLATNDTILVGDTSDTSEVVKAITKSNLITDLGSSFAALSHTHTTSDISNFAEAVEDTIGTKVVAGSNVTVTYNDTTGETTIAANSSAGISRTVVVTSGSATAGSTSATDYFYKIAGAHTISLPAASGNTCRYSFKNSHSANVTIDTVGSETIDGAASISLAPDEAVDIISDGTNYLII